MYTDPLTHRFKKTAYRAVKNVYMAAISTNRVPKKQMLTELDNLCEQHGRVVKIICFRALVFEESVQVLLKSGDANKPTTAATLATWETTAYALEEVLRELKESVQ